MIRKRAGLLLDKWVNFPLHEYAEFAVGDTLVVQLYLALDI
jgi:hypothetical protein